jgi:biopolymer transport protein ExbB
MGGFMQAAAQKYWILPLLMWLASLSLFELSVQGAFAQELPGEGPNPGITQAELQELAAQAATNRAGVPAAPTPNVLQNNLNFLKLLLDGGALMIPIAIMSLLVVAVALERLLALRRGRLFPRGLRREIRRASESSDPVSPHGMFQCSEQYPSCAARILQALLLKVGRPIPEMEAAVAEGTQREADYLYSNVRWLTLAAAVTPLIGLLGTVWGMIIAFYNTTQLGTGSNKAELLAEGIYVALVTTLGGLAVAIPAAIFAHYFEGKISKVLAVIEADLKRLIPRFEDQEGRVRYDINSRGLTRREVPVVNNAVSGSAGRRTIKEGAAAPPPPPTMRPPTTRA